MTEAAATRLPILAPRRTGRRLARLGASALLLLVSVGAMGTGLGLLVLRHELRARDGRDTRPCPACRAPAVIDGRALVDEQGHRLLFATPEAAARYAAGFAER